MKTSSSSTPCKPSSSDHTPRNDHPCTNMHHVGKGSVARDLLMACARCSDPLPLAIVLGAVRSTCHQREFTPTSELPEEEL